MELLKFTFDLKKPQQAHEKHHQGTCFLITFQTCEKYEKDFPSFNYNNLAAVSFNNLQAKFIYVS